MNNVSTHRRLELLKVPRLRLLFITSIGILSGVGLIQYIQTKTLVSMASEKYVILLWLVIPLSSLIWMFLRLVLRPLPVIGLSILYFLGAAMLWLYYEKEPVVVADIVIRGDIFISLFVFIGLLMSTMSLVDYFFLSLRAIRLVIFTVFYLEFSIFTFPALIPEFAGMTKTVALNILGVIMLLLASGWIVLGELVVLILDEGLGRVHYNA
ncbi:hypothetical protein CO110_00225 [Candidatus Desantisbacteria bacterium CG_4_9_14_3_um_filter_40_11]|uniref:Uncharacterized protein n=1 Tax=Candidatus Desantisbacteria bacterium CG_4_9_14_3_um_filter_40_11 TaxID=1974546 RepID=A0A2M8AX32_9BACT|nr:MAG: hypothetical protein CO110_00225 [Candidatus Desantisbacteria bacterium CG_4_9_14_3_um_filter_40_11]